MAFTLTGGRMVLIQRFGRDVTVAVSFAPADVLALEGPETASA